MSERMGSGRRVTNGSDARDLADLAPALRDADAIVARAAEDEAAALEARERFREREIEPLDPVGPIAELLLPGEEILAVRLAALLDRRMPSIRDSGWSPSMGLAGDLYVTSSRLVLVGRTVLEYDLDEICETAVSSERLLLTLSGGAGVTLAIDRPRLLRVEIAAARAWRASHAGAARGARPDRASG